MRVFLIGMICLASWSSASGQAFTKITYPADCKKSILDPHVSMTSLTADFNETVYSSMFTTPRKGTGKLLYKKPQQIRWEHFEPTSKIYLINGPSCRMRESGKEVDGSKARIVGKRIQDLILQLLTGGFLEGNDFSIEYYESAKQYKLLLTPQQKRVSKYISRVDLIFDRETSVLMEMSLVETASDKIVYTFSKYQLNGVIADSNFSTW